MTKVITIITSNKGKINSLKVALSGLDYEVKNMNLDLLEPQFDTIEEVAEFKAKQAFDKLKSALLVHDGGLIIPSLNGFPGVYTKYASTTLGPQDFVNLMKEKEDKSCYLTQCLIYVDENGELHKFQDKGLTCDHLLDFSLYVLVVYVNLHQKLLITYHSPITFAINSL